MKKLKSTSPPSRRLASDSPGVAATASQGLTSVRIDSGAVHTQRQRQQVVDRGIASLYRWYVAKSQRRRNWNPDTDFAWREIRRDLPEDILRIVEGYFAVEQFIPDYACELVSLLRRDYGRSQYYLKWGAEESKHADLWQNVLLATGYRDSEQLEEYSRNLRENSWTLPFDDPLEMLVYTVFQERATQVNYANLRSLVNQPSQHALHDTVLASACSKIAADEVAHFDFFLSATLLYLYYFPERTLAALSRVLAYFEMPAAHIIPGYDRFIDALYSRGIFGKRVYYAQVVKLVCESLAVRDLRDLANQAKQRRHAFPDDGLPPRPKEIFEPANVHQSVIALFKRLTAFERDAEIDHLFGTTFIPYSWGEDG